MNKAEEKLVGKLHGLFFRVASFHPDDFLPETLFHYTSAAGFHGIVSSGELRGTNYSYLNDSSELIHGRDEIVLPILLEKIESQSEPSSRSLLKETHERLTSTAENMDFYLTCFCQSPDLLSQWRGYGDAAGRFCIGFDAEALQSRKDLLKAIQGPVIYDEVRQRTKVEGAIEKAIEILLEGGSTHGTFRSAVVDELARKLLEELCFFKHAGFSEEREWRFVHFARDTSSIYFQPGDGLLKPLVKMVVSSATEPTLPIKEVIVGHSRIGGLATKSARLLLESLGYKDVEVHASSVPFREF